MFRVTEYFVKSLKVIRNDILEKGINTSLQLCLYLVPFVRYSALNNGVTLKSGLEVIQGHSNWYHLKAWVRFPIQLP